MSDFTYRDGVLSAGRVSLADVAEQYGTPCYVYSRQAIESNWSALDKALSACRHLVCYAVKANSNLAVLNLLARLGSGFDIVSAGELHRVIKAGGEPGKVVFSGVGKRTDEIRFALKQGLKCFNVESTAELSRLNAIAGECNATAPVSLRVNPDVDAGSHPYILTGLKENKFGIDMAVISETYQAAAAMENIDVVGIDCHIGSQITQLGPFTDAFKRVSDLIDKLARAGITLKHINIGGGLGITYKDETPPSAEDYVDVAAQTLMQHGLELILEPGRRIVGNAGVLLTKVEYLKETPERNFAVVDAAMNDLIRPSLYDGWHDIKCVNESSEVKALTYDIVGPVCETGDFLGKDRTLRLAQGDVLAVCSAGAYGFSMASNYNSRPRAAELMVDGDRIYEIRKREDVQGLMEGETCLP